MTKFVAIFGVVLLLFVVLVPLAEAHRNGCHAWHSCPSDTGSYVCGDTGHSNYCGNTDTSPSVTAPGVTAVGWAFHYWQPYPYYYWKQSMIYSTLAVCQTYSQRTAGLGYRVGACFRV